MRQAQLGCRSDITTCVTCSPGDLVPHSSDFDGLKLASSAYDRQVIGIEIGVLAR